MTRWKSIFLPIFYIAVVIIATDLFYLASEKTTTSGMHDQLILSPIEYEDQGTHNLWEQLVYRVRIQPFNLIASVIFFFALLHIFFARKFTLLAEHVRNRNIAKKVEPVDSFWIEILRFMGEVEVVFGIWTPPLMIAMTLMYDWKTAIDYLNERHYTEPIFVFVIMVLASTRPIINLAEDCLRAVAQIGGESVKSWWFAILTLGPLLGSFITEPAAMTISAILLGKQFYRLRPSSKFAHATIGLLFTNVSVGGILTNFAAPAVLIVSRRWGWDSYYMFSNFGWKAIIGIMLANVMYFFIFRKEFHALEQKVQFSDDITKYPKEKHLPVPFWISLVHVFFLAWIVVHANFPVVFIGAFLFFLGFSIATSPYQYQLQLKSSLLVGFFLAGLVVHGTLQAWWIEPILQRVSNEMLMVVCIILAAFNDNAAITFLASLIPDFPDSLRYTVLASAVAGGGLTVIANVPNLSGYAILNHYFKRGISSLYLFLAALLPAIIMALTFYLLRNI